MLAPHVLLGVAVIVKRNVPPRMISSCPIHTRSSGFPLSVTAPT